MSIRLRYPVLALALSVAACADDGPSSGWRHSVGAAKGGAAPLSGAIFTTTEDGTRVDANIYDAFCDVYVNGGPAHEGAAGLPEGDYYFQVTDPPGHNLLSTDAVTHRQFHVDGTGRISGLSGAGDHDTGMNAVDGGVTVQLCPFLPTPNPGCEFKVWVTRVADYDLTAMSAKFGFVPSESKTDNFKVCEEAEEPDAGPGEPDAGPGEPDAGPGEPDAGPGDESDGDREPDGGDEESDGDDTIDEQAP